MAWEFVDSYTGSLKTTSNLAVSATAAIGDTLVVCVLSNDVSGSDAIGTTDVTDAQSNTYTRIATNQSQTAAGEIAQAIFFCEVATALSAEDITFTNSTAAKAMIILRFTGGSSTESGAYQTAANDGSGTYSLTHSSVVSGDLVVGFCAREDATGNAFGDDTDTTNGSWVANIAAGTTGGGAASNASGRVQYKITTGTGSQTWDGTVNGSYHREILIALNAGVSGTTAEAITAAVTAAAQQLSAKVNTLTEVASPTVSTSSDATIGAGPTEAAVTASSEPSPSRTISTTIEHAAVTATANIATSFIDASAGFAPATVVAHDATINTGGVEDPTAEPGAAVVATTANDSKASVLAYAEYP